jgi:hypothetical protein
MLHFDAAPPVPSDYRWLCVLAGDEIERARAASYVADSVDPRALVNRPGLDNCSRNSPSDIIPSDDMRDWRVRIYIVWFCYIYENFREIRRPLYAIEELIFEFRAPGVIDLPDRRIATLYAGSGAVSLPHSDRQYVLQQLKPHYEKAINLLTEYRQRNNAP